MPVGSELREPRGVFWDKLREHHSVFSYVEISISQDMLNKMVANSSPPEWYETAHFLSFRLSFRLFMTLAKSSQPNALRQYCLSVFPGLHT